MNNCFAEFLGTLILILFGNGVVANVLLQKSKGQNSGWIVITFGWAMAVFVAVFAVSKYSGAHLNPAVSVCLALAGKFDWSLVPMYILCQVAGAFCGALLVWLTYRQHFAATEDAGLKLAVFSTGPAIPNRFYNLLTETIATAIFLLLVLMIVSPSNSLGSIDALPVALLVLAIGLSLGGPTGYAINPARDLGPRMAHAVLPMGNNKNSQWVYAWIPVVGPLLGAVLAAMVFKAISQ
ncbi:MIP/aquaporin family protein [Flavihumibacter solisilvae]|uniref:Glycerol transporter n=1 Tax=Flavihumibacter solisilvae TaxID=1349421 RepID=A0A0C1LF62_9BACT|nr:MIP/aquaporin family protein [Flavihumibacter solisilvae]KIC93993.1 glycerol transporter [Flavihumibacter solisilvae]